MLRDQLEIVVFTYNRAEPLRRTLQRLLETPFAECRVTVQDNASTDETPAVCAEYAERFPDLVVSRNEINIGGSANYLRGRERSQATYTWILADDDLIEPDAAEEVIRAIESGRFDVLAVASPEAVEGRPDPPEPTAPVVTTTQGYLRSGHRRFWSFTFVATVIFRTELFDSQLVVAGYRNCANSYPHFPFVTMLAERPLPLWVSGRSLIRRDGAGDTTPSWLYWWRIWLGSCDTIADRRLRHEVVEQGAWLGMSFTRALALPLVTERLEFPTRALPLLLELAGRRVAWRQRLTMIALVPLAIIPPWAYRLAKWVVFRKPVVARRDPGAAYDDLRL